MTDPESERAQRGLDRMLTFTDAVVAIAITLVMLPLVDSARETHGASVSAYFHENSAGLEAALISFWVIAALWREHHSLFERAVGYSPWLLRTNMLWLAAITALPLVTSLESVAAYGDRAPGCLYLCVVGAAMLIARLQEFLLARTGRLEGEQMTPALVVQLTVPVVLLVLAIVFELTVPHVGLWSTLLLVLSRPIAFLITRWIH
jgi:uncharacterized membrane protein